MTTNKNKEEKDGKKKDRFRKIPKRLTNIRTPRIHSRIPNQGAIIMDTDFDVISTKISAAHELIATSGLIEKIIINREEKYEPKKEKFVDNILGELILMKVKALSILGIEKDDDDYDAALDLLYDIMLCETRKDLIDEAWNAAKEILSWGWENNAR